MREVFRDVMLTLGVIFAGLQAYFQWRGPAPADPPVVQTAVSHPIGGLILVAGLFVLAGILNSAPLLSRLIPKKVNAKTPGAVIGNLPSDWKTRYEEANKLYLEANRDRAEFRGKYAECANELNLLKAGPSPLSTANALAALPVYWQDLEVKLLNFRRGTSLTSGLTFLLYVSIVSDVDTGIRDIEASCKIGDRSYRLKPLDDLSQWIVRTEKTQSNWPHKNTEDRSLQELSLWTELRHEGLKSGLEKTGWLGFTVDDANFTDMPKKLALIISKPNQQRSYRFWFLDATDSEEYPRVFASAFKIA